MNPLTTKIHAKGYTLDEFLLTINRSRDWFYKHSLGGKDYEFLLLAIAGLDKPDEPDLRSKHDL